ncbi:MAG: hypothetical protein GTO18_15635 [Anaerolineales bacterium]|nr:hypothetical protein [Anaerolineales bacterium]
MRVTREKLITLARSEAELQGKTGDVISGYLIGSVVSGDPILGGSADVDLVLIHNYTPDRQHELKPLSPDFHLDITHHSRELYQEPTALRIDPWLGPSMCEPIFLYDPGHFFERAQAGVRGQFYRGDHIHARASAFLELARNSKVNIQSDDNWIRGYLNSMLEAANAAVTLSGFPVAGRRLSPILKTRLQDFERPDLYLEFERLLGADLITHEGIVEWLTEWREVSDLRISIDSSFPTERAAYFHNGFQALLDVGQSKAILWQLLNTWAEGIVSLRDLGVEKIPKQIWHDALGQLRLNEEAQINRQDELEGFIDQIEELVEVWGDRYDSYT